MHYKKKILAQLVLTALVLCVSILLGNSDKIGLCSTNIASYDTSCVTRYEESFAQPIFFLSLSLLATSIILFFVRESVFKSWRRFAYWAVPIGAIILWLAPTSTPGGIGISFLDFTKQSASWLVSSAFLLISLWIIVSRSLHATSK